MITEMFWIKNLARTISILYKGMIGYNSKDTAQKYYKINCLKFKTSNVKLGNVHINLLFTILSFVGWLVSGTGGEPPASAIPPQTLCTCSTKTSKLLHSQIIYIDIRYRYTNIYVYILAQWN